MKYKVLALIACGISTVLAEDNLGSALHLFFHKLKEGLTCGFGEVESMTPFILADGGEKLHIVDIDTPDFV